MPDLLPHRTDANAGSNGHHGALAGVKRDLALMAGPLTILFILSPPAAIILGIFALVSIADNYWDGIYDDDTSSSDRGQ
jgi:hypothetical protein